MVNEGDKKPEPTPTEPRRLLDGLLGLMPLRLAGWVTVVAAVFPGFFSDPHLLINFMDDHQFSNWEEADRISILGHGQLPLWNPYYCGGMVSAAAPESGVFSPDFLLRLIFGVSHGRRFALLLFLVLGMEGTYRLNRAIQGSAFSGIFAALIFTTCNRLLQTYLGMGWVNFFGFELVPWVLLAFIKGRESVPWRLVGALFLGWIALAAGTYTAPYTGIAVIFVTVALACASLARPQGRRWAELKASIFSGATIGIGALGLSFVKLLPMTLLMRQYPRTFTPLENNEPFGLLQQYWHVYAIVILLAFVALLFADFWARAWFAGAILFFTLAMGHFSDWAPASLMKKLPLLSGLRFPDRFMVMFHLFAVLGAARGLSHVEDLFSKIAVGIWSFIRKPKKRKPIENVLIPLSFTALAAAIVIHHGRPEIEDLLDHITIKPHTLFVFEPARPVVQEFKQHRGNRRDAHIFPVANMGTLYCFVGIPIPESAFLRGDLAQEEYPAEPSAAKVQRVKWTPHAITLKVEASKPTRVLVNQNYNPHWTVDVGTVVDDRGLLGIDVPAGTHELTVRYRDGTTYFALFVSLLTLGAMLYYLGKKGLVVGKERWHQYMAWGIPLNLIRAPEKDDEKKKSDEKKKADEKEEEEKEEEKDEEEKAEAEAEKEEEEKEEEEKPE